jgi:uncharacterized heparinase superfamily protein
MAGTISVRRRIVTFALSESLRRVALRYHQSFVYRPRYVGPQADRLLIAPTDLRTSDATLAHDVYAGRFIFCGIAVDTGGTPVFAVEPPTEGWARELHGFGWLRHLRASELRVSRSNARSLVRDWIRHGGRHHPIAWEPTVLARRVMSWLSQSPLVLEGCDHAFYKRFMRSLTSQVRALRRIAPNGPPGLPRLTMMMAVAAAAVALPDQERFMRQAAKWLEAELALQVLPDGCHVSRSPSIILELLADLLPLRQAYTARGLQPPQGLITAVDRMMPMVRFFRHADGALARFNGTSDTPVDLIATVLAYDDARGAPVSAAPHSGFRRLAAGDTVVVIDTGPPPPIALSSEAHAGCLSFELSSGRQRIIVNCGAGGVPGSRLRRLSRTTAAHSTATIDDCSSCRFLVGSALSRHFGEVVAEGPVDVLVEQGEEDEGAEVIAASHDGYADRFGIIHERRLKLSSTGHRLDGLDHFRAADGSRLAPGAGKHKFAIRFHVHPTANLRPLESPGQVLIALADGEAWQFSADAPVEIEESIFFSETHGSRRSSQIVISGIAQLRDTVSWWLQRVALPGRRRTERIEG